MLMILIETGLINFAKITNLLSIFNGNISAAIKINPINRKRINRLEVNNRKAPYEIVQELKSI